MPATSTPDTSIAAVRLTPSSSEGNPLDPHDYYDYTKASGVFSKLIDEWRTPQAEIDRQRALRYTKDSESESLRQRGILLADEMYCPNRLIDQNIRAEKPAIIKYFTQSKSSVVFESGDNATVDNKELLEEDFTKKARYEGFAIPWLECFDGAQAHGKDSLEVVFDTTKPGDFSINHIGPGRLIFAVDSEDIKAQEVLAIEKMLTSNQLKTMKGFNQEQVAKLIQTNANKNSGQQDCTNKCYKFYFKQEEIVHVCWYAKEGCDDFLYKPEPLFLGKRDFTQPKVLEEGATTPDYPPVYEEDIPIYLLRYTLDNDPKLIETCGRAKLDEPSQEAASALQTAMINGSLRSSKVMGAPKQNDFNKTPNAAPKMTDSVIGHGRLWDQPMDFFTTPPPPASLVSFINAVVTQNKQDQNSGINFAALNRKDSEKTATEINAAESASQELGSVQVILLAIFILEVYKCCWTIYQNRVLQGKLVIKNPSLLVLFGEGIQADPETGVVISCKSAIEYILKSSGDRDVIQRERHLRTLMEGWPVFGKTIIANEYLKDIIRYAFPDDASKYINIIDQGVANEADALKQLLLKTGKALQAVIMNPAEVQGMEVPLQGLAMEIMQAVGSPNVPPNQITNPIEQVQNQLQSMQPNQKAA